MPFQSLKRQYKNQVYNKRKIKLSKAQRLSHATPMTKHTTEPVDSGSHLYQYFFLQFEHGHVCLKPCIFYSVVIGRFVMSNAITIENDTILWHKSSHENLWLVNVCPHMAHWHTFTNHNSPCGELWHKVVPFLVVLALLICNRQSLVRALASSNIALSILPIYFTTHSIFQFLFLHTTQ